MKIWEYAFFEFPNLRRHSTYTTKQCECVGWYSLIFSENEIFNAVKTGQLESLKTLLEGKKENDPVISTFDDGTELRVLDKAAFFGHLNVMIWYTEILGYTYNATSKI